MLTLSLLYYECRDVFARIISQLSVEDVQKWSMISKEFHRVIFSQDSECWVATFADYQNGDVIVGSSETFKQVAKQPTTKSAAIHWVARILLCTSCNSRKSHHHFTNGIGNNQSIIRYCRECFRMVPQISKSRAMESYFLKSEHLIGLPCVHANRHTILLLEPFVQQVALRVHGKLGLLKKLRSFEERMYKKKKRKRIDSIGNFVDQTNPTIKKQKID